MSEPTPGPEEISHDLFERLVESVAAVTYVLRFGHADEPPLFVSPQCEVVVGLPPEALMVDARGRNQLLHPEDRKRIWEHATHVDASGGDWDEEYRLIQPDGSFRWVHDQALVVPEAPGHPACWFGVLTDLTRTKDAERALADSEAKYRALVEQVPAVIYIDTYEEHPKTLFANAYAEQLSGYRPDEWIDDPDLWLRSLHPDDRLRFEEEWFAQPDDEETLTCEYRIFRKDGLLLWVKDVARLIRSDDGTPLFWQGVIVDVTERRESEEHLRDSEARYRGLVEDIPAFVYVATDEPDPSMTYVSPQLEEIVGYTPEQWTGDQDLWWKVMPDEHGRRVLAEWEACVRDRTTFSTEYPTIRSDGRVVWLRDIARLVATVDEGSFYWHGVVLDISDSKLAEEALQRSNARFRALVEHSPAVVYEMSLDDERQTLYVSPHVEELFGYSRQEWLDQPDIWTELLHPEDREIELAAHDLHNETGQPWSQEYRLIASDGRVVWVRDQAVLVRDRTGQPPRWQGIMLDITSQKELEERLRLMNDELELRVSERTAELAEANEMMALEIGERQRIQAELGDAHERYRKLVEDVPAVVYIWHVGPTATTDPRSYTSPRVEQMLGYTSDEWEDPTLWEERLHPHDRDRVLAGARRSEATGEPFEDEYRILAKDGSIVWVLDHCTLLTRDRYGEPELFQGVLMDITSRKAAERKAKEAEERLRTLAETGPAATYVYELEREGREPVLRLLYKSPHISELLGRSIKDRFESPEQFLSFVHPDDRERLMAEVREQWRTGADFDRNLRLIAADGRVIWVHNKGRCIARDERGRPLRFHSVLLDVTRQKEEQERLHRSEAQLRSLVEGLPGIPWIEIVEGEPGRWRLAYIGDRVEEVLGYTAEELLAEPGHFERLVHPGDRDRINAMSVHHDLTEEPWRAQYRARTRDGQIRWLWSEGVPSRDEQGRLVWTGITFDVTAMHATDDTTTVPEAVELDS
jgi:PAS domain S-box-containing protein